MSACSVNRRTVSEEATNSRRVVVRRANTLQPRFNNEARLLTRRFDVTGAASDQNSAQDLNLMVRGVSSVCSQVEVDPAPFQPQRQNQQPPMSIKQRLGSVRGWLYKQCYLNCLTQFSSWRLRGGKNRNRGWCIRNEPLFVNFGNFKMVKRVFIRWNSKTTQRRKICRTI